MTLRRLVYVLGVGACAIALAGCGGDTFALDPVANAASKTAETESARISFTATVDVSTVGTMSINGRGIYDGRSKTGWMNANFTLPAQFQAELGANPSMEMIFDASDGLVMFMRSSMFEQFAADKWLKLDLEKLADQEGVDLGAIMNANQADPNQTLRMLMASSGARATGSDSVRGVRTTRYAFRVDLKKLAEENEALRESLDQVIRVVGVNSYPAQAWIDAQGRVRRIKIAMSLAVPQGKATMTMTEDLYDFGVRATIFPPPDDQVIDFSALMGSGS